MILVATSLLFTIPMFIAYKKKLHRDAILAGSLASISTLNHGFKCENQIIRKLDVATAHTIGTIFVMESIIHHHNFINFINLLPIIVTLNTAFIYYAKAHHKNKNQHSKIWHTCMHISTCIGWCLYLALK